MGDDAFSATGTFELTMGDSTMDIDLSAADQNGDSDGFIDASELVNAINDSDDNPGVSAALVKTDSFTILITSDSTGAQSARFDDVTGHDASNDSTSAPVAYGCFLRSGRDYSSPVAPARPAITNSSNTFDDVIPGVTMTFPQSQRF